MGLIKLNITPEFIRGRTQLTWQEMFFGIDNELLSPGAAADFAAHQVGAQDNANPTLVELAGVCSGETTRDLVEQLAAAEPRQSSEAMRRKWIYLMLAWIFEHKESYPDPLRAVEEVYADFGYPDFIVSLVRYMPVDEPSLGSREANESRLYDKWKRYLDSASDEFNV